MQRIRLQEERDNPKLPTPPTQPKEDLATALGDDMDAEVSLDSTPDEVEETSTQNDPTTPGVSLVYNVEHPTPNSADKFTEDMTPEAPRSLAKAKEELNKALEEVRRPDIIETALQNNMCRQIVSHNHVRDRLLRQLIATEKCNASLTEALKSSVEEKEDLMRTNADLVARLEDFERVGLDLEEDSKVLNSELDQLKAENIKLKEQLKSSSSRAAKSGDEAAQLKKEVASLKMRAGDVSRAHHESSKASEAKLQKEVQQLKKLLESKADSESSQIASLTREVSGKESRSNEQEQCELIFILQSFMFPASLDFDNVSNAVNTYHTTHYECNSSRPPTPTSRPSRPGSRPSTRRPWSRATTLPSLRSSSSPLRTASRSPPQPRTSRRPRRRTSPRISRRQSPKSPGSSQRSCRCRRRLTWTSRPGMGRRKSSLTSSKR